MDDNLKMFLGKLHTYLDRRIDRDEEDTDAAELMSELEPILFNSIMSAIGG